MTAEFVSICAGGGALTAWALHLGASPAIVALLAGLPALAQALQLPAARLTARFGAHRTATVAALVARQPYALLIPLPWLPIGGTAKVGILVGVAAVAAALGTVAQHAWMAWMTELFRAPARLRVFTHRTSRLSFVSAAGGLAVGVLLDRAGAARDGALSVLALVAWVAGAASAALLQRQHAPRAARRRRAVDFSMRAAIADRPVRRGLRYVVAWNTALGLTASFWAMYMLRQLGIGFVGLGMHGLAVATGSVLLAPLWGRLIERVGIGRVIVASTAGAALLPFLWMLSSARVTWPIVLDAVLAGALLSGHSAALTALPVEVAPPGRRGEVIAAYSTASGVAFGAASLASGIVAARLPFFVLVADRLVVARNLVFAAGGAIRVVAALLGLKLLRRDRHGGDAGPA